MNIRSLRIRTLKGATFPKLHLMLELLEAAVLALTVQRMLTRMYTFASQLCSLIIKLCLR
jgi:hypothetical protein